MWRGITLEKGATLIMDDALIEDAQYGIRALDEASITVTNSTFRRNFVGIYTESELSTPGLASPIAFGSFYGNVFDGEGGLKATFPGQGNAPAIGFTGKAFAGVWLGRSGTFLHSLNNQYLNLSNGIYSLLTNLRSTNDVFTNIFQYGYPSWMAGYGIRAQGGNEHIPNLRVHRGYFNCDKGIRADRVNAEFISGNQIRGQKGIELYACFPRARVLQNEIQSTRIGVELGMMDPGAKTDIFQNQLQVRGGRGIQNNMMGPVVQSGNVAVRHNIINLWSEKTTAIEMNSIGGNDIHDNEIFVDKGLSFYQGIRLNNDYKSLLSCNQVLAAKPTWNGSYGMDIWDAEYTGYNCNSVDGPQYGVRFNMAGPSPENFGGTSFANNQRGLFLGATSAIGPQTHKGNTWNGDFGDYGAGHGSSDLNQLDLSKFTVHSNSTTFFPELSSNIPPDSWFKIEVTGEPTANCDALPACNIDLVKLNLTGGLHEIDKRIAEDNFSTESYNTEMTKLARRYLYRKLGQSPELVTSGSVYESFKSTEDGTLVGGYAAKSSARAALFVLPQNTAEQIESELHKRSNYEEEVVHLDNLLMEAGQGNPDMVQARESKIGLIHGYDEALSDLIAPIRNGRATNAEVLKTQYSTLPNGDLLDENERTVNEIYLNTVVAGELTFTSTEEGQLKYIALQCPLTGGSAVFQARSLLSLVGDDEYDDDDICGLQVEERNGGTAANGISGNGFSLFPNPAQNEVTLVVPGGVKEGRVTLVNSLGIIVHESVLVEGERFLSLNTSHIGTGLYLFTFYENEAPRFIEKLIINK